MDANLLHISYEGDILEDPWNEAEDDMWRWSVSPEQAPDEPTYIEIEYKKGDPVALNGEALSPATMLETLNKIGGENGVGRLDIVENRYVGMKSRGCYETPGGTIMLKGTPQHGVFNLRPARLVLDPELEEILESTLIIHFFILVSILVLNVMLTSLGHAKEAKKELPKSKDVIEFLAKTKKLNTYPQCSKNPLPIQQEDYKKNYMALRGLTGIYDCCLASTWTSFAQGARVLRDSKTNYRLSTWGEGHSTSDCTNLTEWYQKTVIQTIENFIETKIKADTEYEKEQKELKKLKEQKKASPQKNVKPGKKSETKEKDKSKLEAKKSDEKKDQKNKNDTNKKASKEHNVTKVGNSAKVEAKASLNLKLSKKDESAISESKVASLDKVIKIIKSCTHYNFIVETHSDSRSEIEYNKHSETRRSYLETMVSISTPPTYHELAILLFKMDNSCMPELKASSPIGDTRSVKEAKMITKAFGGALQKELKKAMKAGGAINALNVCNTEAMPITKQAAIDHKAIVTRVSLKNRNPENIPNEWQKLVLEDFDTRAAKGESVKKMGFSKIVRRRRQKDITLYESITNRWKVS
ncbi:Argininosuccinate synthase [Nymphon striatum]|nr:Argininosuccinate synthase [Nymphon striatum]